MRVLIFDKILKNKDSIFALLNESEEQYAFSDEQMQQIEEHLLLRSVSDLPESFGVMEEQKEEPDSFVQAITKASDIYEVWKDTITPENKQHSKDALTREEMQQYIGVHTLLEGLRKQKEKAEVLVLNAKPDSCLEEENYRKLALYLNTANTRLERRFSVQYAILPDADFYFAEVKVIADLLQQYNIPLLLQASLQTKFGAETFAQEGTAMWHALGQSLIDKNSPAKKNTLLCYPNLSAPYEMCYIGAAYVVAASLCVGADPMTDTHLPRELYPYTEDTQNEIEYDPYGCMLIGYKSTMHIKDFNTLEGKRIYDL